MVWLIADPLTHNTCLKTCLPWKEAAGGELIQLPYSNNHISANVSEKQLQSYHVFSLPGMSSVPDFIVSEWVRTNKAENSSVYDRAVIQINKWVGFFWSSLQDFLEVNYYKKKYVLFFLSFLRIYIYKQYIKKLVNQWFTFNNYLHLKIFKGCLQVQANNCHSSLTSVWLQWHKIVLDKLLQMYSLFQGVSTELIFDNVGLSKYKCNYQK